MTSTQETDAPPDAARPRRGRFIAALVAAILLPLLAAMLGLPPFDDRGGSPVDSGADAQDGDAGETEDAAGSDEGTSDEAADGDAGLEDPDGGDAADSAAAADGDNPWGPIEHVLRITLCDDVGCPLEDGHIDDLDEQLSADPDVLGHLYLDPELTYHWLTAELEGLAGRIDADRIAGMFHVTLVVGVDPEVARLRYASLPGVGEVAWLTQGLTPQQQVRERERLGFDEDSRRIAIHLCGGEVCPAITDDQRVALEDALAADPDVVDITRDTVEEAFERFLERFADDPDAAEGVDPETLARPLRITIGDGVDALGVVERYLDADGVADVIWERGERG